MKLLAVALVCLPTLAFAQTPALERDGATPHGRVLTCYGEAFVEGENEAVARVERAVRSGPPGARVKTVNVIEEDAAGAYKTFTIEG